MKRIKNLSSVYVITSIFLGPAIVFYALGRGKDGMDCSEGSWNAITQAAKNEYFHEAAVIMAISSAIMLGLGAYLIYQLLSSKKDVGVFLLALLMTIVMAGYLLVMFQANSWNC